TWPAESQIWNLSHLVGLGSRDLKAIPPAPRIKTKTVITRTRYRAEISLENRSPKPAARAAKPVKDFKRRSVNKTPRAARPFQTFQGLKEIKSNKRAAAI